MNYTDTPNSNALVKLIVERSENDPNRLTLKIPNYSPFFSEVVNLIRKLPYRRYHSIPKNWGIPFEQKTLDELIRILGPNLFFTFNWQDGLKNFSQNNKNEVHRLESNSNGNYKAVPFKEEI